MQRFQAIVSVFLWGAVNCALSVVPNEWSFIRDSSGLTLSQVENSGANPTAFSSGGEGFLETDGAGGLLCTHSGSASNGMWISGAVLNAAVSVAPEAVQYIRCDLRYDLSEVKAGNGMVLGFSMTDDQGTEIAGIAITSLHRDAPIPDGRTLTQVATKLAAVGRLSAIVGVNITNQTASVWYDSSGTNNFDWNNPALSNAPISLASIDKLQFQATGDYRTGGSENYVVIDNLRMASTWDEISHSVYLPLSVTPVFCHNMVLQRDMDVPLWGQISPGAKVTVKLDDQLVGSTVADANGTWRVSVGVHSTDGGIAHVIQIVSGDQQIQINEVVFGDVYLASGQSNMALLMTGVTGYEEELAVANSYPLIRQTQLASDVEGAAYGVQTVRWGKCSQTELANFSGVGYFFAKNMYLQTGVPVGLICFAWGGRGIESFLCPEGMEAVPELSGMLQNQEQGNVTNLYLFNPIVDSLVPYGIRGAIWYQGEANSASGGDGDIYQFKMQALMRGWRKKWGQGNFPFYYVQLAALNETRSFPGVRQAQLRALSETNTGMAVTIDIGEEFNVHPRDKADVGFRLAQWVLAKDMGYDRDYSGPLFRSAIPEGAQIRVLFDYADGGLLVGQKNRTNIVLEAAEPLQNFQVAGADKKFTDAVAVIDQDTVVVSSPSVSQPLYVRYCYTMWPAGSNKLYNAAGFPASPFRTDGGYPLYVISGNGGASERSAGSVVTLTASAPQSGEVFDRWIGAAAEVQALNLSSTTITMPDHALYLLATYRNVAEPVYELTVGNGSGSGKSKAGSILNIEAATPPPGQQFDYWSGDTQAVVHVSLSHTTLRMPQSNITVAAVYRTVDSVGDGIADIWRSTYFEGAETQTNDQSSADADPDGDGMTNRQEFQVGTSPVDAQSVLRLEGTFSRNIGTLRFQGKSGLRYRLEKTSTLTPPSWSPVFYNIGGKGRMEWLPLETTDSESNGFYRLLLNAN